MALEIKRLYPNTIIVPFEPYTEKEGRIDSGFRGLNSASYSNINPLWKSWLLFIRYVLHHILFLCKLHLADRTDRYVIYTRGILEFGLNRSHSRFPSGMSRLAKRILQPNSVLIVSNVSDILERKPELTRDDLIILYFKYFNAGLRTIDNTKSLEECARRVINEF